MDPTAETVNLEFTSNNIGNWTLILARRLEVTIKEFSRLVQKTRRPTEADFDHARYALAVSELFDKTSQGRLALNSTCEIL